MELSSDFDPNGGWKAVSGRLRLAPVIPASDSPSTLRLPPEMADHEILIDGEPYDPEKHHWFTVRHLPDGSVELSAYPKAAFTETEDELGLTQLTRDESVEPTASWQATLPWEET